ncbi:MAG: hypothetical protein OEZ02_14545 [Anaerolineae bacterium]|nr:hypothetical protein [Anaerolineae bacterium]
MSGSWKLFARRLNVQAECLYIGNNNTPTSNLVIVSVTYNNGTPLTGLKAANFRLVNYAMHDGHARPVKIGKFIELSNELKNHQNGFTGVYKIEPIDEDYLINQIGQTVYAVDVLHIPGIMTVDYGQAVASLFMQRHPDEILVSINAMVNS